MNMRRAFVVVLSVLLAASIGSCAKREKKGGLKVNTGIAARIGNIKISEEEVSRRFAELSEQQQNEFKGREGRAKFVDRLIEQQLVYRAALAAGLDKDDEVKQRLQAVTENILASEYYARNVQDKVKVTSEEIAEYYNANQGEFTNPAVLRAQYLFSVDSLKAAGWLKKLKGGANFNKLAKEESEDRSVAGVLGDLGYFNPGGYIKSIGTSRTFSEAVEKLSVGQISGVIHFEKGYAVVKLTEKTEPKVKDLSVVSKMIEGKLTQKKASELFTQDIEQLKQKYPIENYVRESLKETTRSPEELWEVAQLETDPRARIQYYRDLVTLYPKHKNAPQALFMIGFVYAEDLQDFVMARRAFDELERTYPESDMVASAKWMAENMGKPRPRFDSVEKMQEAMEGDTAGPGAERK